MAEMVRDGSHQACQVHVLLTAYKVAWSPFMQTCRDSGCAGHGNDDCNLDICTLSADDCVPAANCKTQSA